MAEKVILLRPPRSLFLALLCVSYAFMLFELTKGHYDKASQYRKMSYSATIDYMYILFSLIKMVREFISRLF